MRCKYDRSEMTSLVLSLILTVLGTNAASLARADYTMGRCVVGRSGGTTAGATHGSTVTCGQPVAGRSAGPAHRTELGFWYVVLILGGPPPTGVADTPLHQLPRAYRLGQNSPNPFFTRTSIPFDIAGSGPVSLKVYDVQGRVIAALVDEHLEPGHHVAGFAADQLASGVYFCRLRAAGQTMVRRLVLAR